MTMKSHPKIAISGDLCLGSSTTTNALTVTSGDSEGPSKMADEYYEAALAQAHDRIRFLEAQMMRILAADTLKKARKRARKAMQKG